MHSSEHASTRMNQRAINSEMVELTLAYGEADGDRVTLSPKNCRDLIDDLKQKQKKLEHALKKGGITVVSEANTLITVFRANSFSTSKAKKGRG